MQQQPTIQRLPSSNTSSQTGGENSQALGPAINDPGSEYEDAEQETIMTTEKLLMPRFEGDTAKVKIESWIDLFELVHDITDNKAKIKKLVTYLKDGAMDWFCDTIMPRIDTIQFSDIKTEMVTRFNRDLVEPIIQVQNRKLKRDETVTEYFNDKISILRRTGLKVPGQIAMLTEGMPQHFRTPLISSRPSDTNAWLSLALDLESSFSQNKKFMTQALGPKVEAVHITNKRNNRDGRRPAGHGAQKPSGRKPPGPCRYCKSRGQENWHWNNECHDQTMAAMLEGPDTASVNITLAKNGPSDQPH